MNRKSGVLLSLLFVSSLIFSQNMSSVTSLSPNTVEGGLGITYIDGAPYTTLSICPDLSLGKIGVGLNIELLFDNQNSFKFRDTGWDNPLRMIRYLRYGQKYDRFYGRIGSLDAATLGNGMIMWNYSNMANYDLRKVGLALDVDFNLVGFESMISNLNRSEIYGGRVYVRPLLKTSLPIIDDTEFGATYVTDIDPDTTSQTDQEIAERGLDVSVPVIKMKMIQTRIYFDYAEIKNYGNGKAVGILFNFPGISGVFDLAAKFEHRWIGKQFMPSYFNGLYELQRIAYMEDPNTEVIYSKQEVLANALSGKGYFGQLAGTVVGKIHIMGSFQKIGDVPNSGLFHLEALMPNVFPNVRVRAAYDKSNIESISDINTLDIFSVASAEVGYKIYPFIYFSIRYRWNFIYDENENKFRTQERIEPRVSFAYEF